MRRERVENMHTYSIKGALPVVGDIWFTFCGLFKDPLVALIRCNFPHQPVPKIQFHPIRAQFRCA